MLPFKNVSLPSFMSDLLHDISDDLRQWLEQQPVFFIATAPLAAAHHLNLSPKGGGSFRVLDSRAVAYLDLTGSGAETIAHLRENGRIIVMFCAFAGPPRIVRLHGRGEVVTREHGEFAALAALFPPQLGARSVIRIRLERVSKSCGYAVPLMEFKSDRDALEKWAESKGEAGLSEYRAKTNAQSIDGLSALEGWRS